eukprot:COSAG01_NODE_4122_length_5331_cov_11.476873_2_plen_164_part_00
MTSWKVENPPTCPTTPAQPARRAWLRALAKFDARPWSPSREGVCRAAASARRGPPLGPPCWPASAPALACAPCPPHARLPTAAAVAAASGRRVRRPCPHRAGASVAACQLPPGVVYPDGAPDAQSVARSCRGSGHARCPQPVDPTPQCVFPTAPPLVWTLYLP